MEKNKWLKWNVLPMEAADTGTTVINEVQDDDCLIISYWCKKQDISTDMVRHKKLLDETFAPISMIKKYVLSTSELNDESLDIFLHIIRETFCFETQCAVFRIFSHDFIQ